MYQPIFNSVDGHPVAVEALLERNDVVIVDFKGRLAVGVGDRDRVATPVAHLAFRVVQEAIERLLRDALKAADRMAVVTVSIRTRMTVAVLRVRDDGRHDRWTRAVERSKAWE